MVDIKFEDVRMESYRTMLESVNKLNIEEVAKTTGLNLSIKEGGEVEVLDKKDGTESKSLTELLSGNLMSNLSKFLNTEETTKLNDHLEKSKTEFPTSEEMRKNEAESRKNDNPTKAKDKYAFEPKEKSKLTPEEQGKQSQFVRDIAKASAKFVLLAGLTVGGLYLLNTARNGCWIMKNGVQFARVNKETKNEQCNLCGNNNAKAPESNFINACTTAGAVYADTSYCELTTVDSSTGANVVSHADCCSGADHTACSCYDQTCGPEAENHVITFKVVNESIFDTFSSTVASIGAYIKRITDDVLELAESAMDFLKMLAEYWWVIVIIVVVIIIIVVVATVVPKSKAKKTKPPNDNIPLPSLMDTSGIELPQV